MDPPEPPNILRGTALQWGRCVRTGTSTAPWTPMRGLDSWAWLGATEGDRSDWGLGWIISQAPL